MDPEIIYNIQPGPYWNWKVAVDLFFGGAGVGALLFAVGIHSVYKEKYQRICGTAALLAPLLVLTGLGFLMLKMGRPLAMWQVFLHAAPTSPLWWGGIFQTLLVVGSLVYAAMWLRPSRDNLGGRALLGWLLTPIAVIVGGYHGLLLAVVKARPLWSHGPTVVAAVLAFIATGISAVMLVHLLRMRVAGRLVEDEHLDNFLSDMLPVRNLLVAALTLQVGTAALWWIDLRFGGARSYQALEAANAAFGPMFWGMGIGAGLLLPLALGAYVVLSGGEANKRLQLMTITITSALVLVGGFFFRLAVVYGGQVPLPAATLY